MRKNTVVKIDKALDFKGNDAYQVSLVTRTGIVMYTRTHNDPTVARRDADSWVKGLALAGEAVDLTDHTLE